MVSEAMRKAQSRVSNRMRLLSPDNCYKVVGKGIFWSVPVLQRYLERVNDLLLERPEDALAYGRWAAPLANRIPVGEERAGYATATEKRSWFVRALATWGSACRVAGKFDEAERAFGWAFQEAKRGEISTFARAELLRRYGALLFARKDSRARSMLDEAVELYRQIDPQDREGLALALCFRGSHALIEENRSGMTDFAEAMTLVDTTSERNRRIATALLNNIALNCALLTPSLSECEAAIHAIRRAKKMSTRSRATVAKAKLTWVEGLLYARFNFGRLATRRVARARELMRRLKEPLEYALASVDLAAILWVEDQNRDVLDVARETEAALREEFRADGALLAILARWSRKPVLPNEDAYQALREEIRTVGKRKASPPCAPSV